MFHTYTHRGLILLTNSIKDEVSSADGSMRGQMGKSREADEVCGFNMRHLRTQPRDNREPHSTPQLPTSLQVSEHKMLSPTFLLWPPSWEDISWGSPCSQLRGDHPAQRDCPGTGDEAGAGTRAIHRQGGSSGYWRLTLIQVGTKAAPSPRTLPVAPESSAPNPLRLQPCLVRAALQLATTCRI